METSAPSSTVTTTEVTAAPPAPASSYVLDISLISAQDLAPVSKSMRTYAIAWIHPSRKLTSRVDQQGNNNPLWNDRFAFRVHSEFLSSEQSAVTIEIYSSCWFRDVLVGTVKVLVSDLVSPYAVSTTRYVALQIRRPSGNPQGILNMGVGLIHASDKSFHTNGDQENAMNKSLIHPTEKQGIVEHVRVGENEFHELIEEFPNKGGSVYNGSGSMCNGSELCSDVGPSASIVAAEMSCKFHPPVVERVHKKAENDDGDDFSHSIVEELTMEEATAKGFKPSARKLRKEVSLPTKRDDGSCLSEERGIPRRHSDGGAFSCFGGAMGIEISVVCGASKPKGSKGKARSRRRYIGSETNSY